MTGRHQFADGRWSELSLMDQLGNIGTEVARAARAKEAGNADRAWHALERALELFDLTIADPRWRSHRLGEICRAREVVCDFIAGDNVYGSTAESLDRYFLPFATAARLEYEARPLSARSAEGALARPLLTPDSYTRG